jgi:hypothetical protein
MQLQPMRRPERAQSELQKIVSIVMLLEGLKQQLPISWSRHDVPLV